MTVIRISLVFLIFCSFTLHANRLSPASPGTPQPRLNAAELQVKPLLFVDRSAIVPQLSRQAMADNTLVHSDNGRFSLYALGHLEWESFNNRNYGQPPIGHNDFFNQRLNLYSNIQFNQRWRLFAALKHADQTGSETNIAPIEQDELDLHQAVIEYRTGFENNSQVLFRLGRQELHYGAGRLISLREGPNVRNDYDGVLLRFTTAQVNTDLLAFYDVTEDPYSFDNKTNEDASLAGVYSILQLKPKQFIDIYYLNDREDEQPYLQGLFDEHRHTVGARWWIPPQPGWSGDLEAG